jgi:hypothetical protein
LLFSLLLPAPAEKEQQKNRKPIQSCHTHHPIICFIFSGTTSKVSFFCYIHLSVMMSSMLTNIPIIYHLLVLFLLGHQPDSSVGFLMSSPSSFDAAARSSNHHFLYVDQFNGMGGEYSRETIESSKSNQWGIPSSKTLDPFSPTPMDQLDNGGRITLVGSGPGDPDLLTIKALKLLQDPDALVIVDRLVSKEIVDLIKGEVKVARKLPGCAELAQEEIYWWAHKGLAAGKHVIRLKIGDPFVFGRGGEEVLQFRKFGVESKVVPVSLGFRSIQIHQTTESILFGQILN